MKLRLIIATFTLISFFGYDAISAKEPNKAKEQVKLVTNADSLSYSIGVQVGNGLKKDNIKINADVLKAGILDFLADENNLALKREDMDKLFNNLSQEIQAKKAKEASEKSIENEKISKAFLEKNKTQAGVKVTPSGLQYKITVEGKGDSPKPESTVKVHYRGTLINGKQFDASYDRNEPVEFPLSGVIKGWTEGLQLMKVGGKATFYIPGNLAYGEQGAAGGQIGPNETLIFEVELLDIIKTDAAPTNTPSK